VAKVVAFDRYSEWLVKQRDSGWTVIDLHSPMTAAVKKQRETDPKFTLQPDGVHPSADGHWVMAQQLIAALGDKDVAAVKSPFEFFAKRKIPWKFSSSSGNDSICSAIPTSVPPATCGPAWRKACRSRRRIKKQRS
jgi:hypothetical protein